MKDKATLSLMELLVMVLVFSLAAALCLKAFVWSTQKAAENKVIAGAAIAAQSAAEQMKAAGEARTGEQYLDENWQPVSENGCYVLKTEPFSAALLGGAEITVEDLRGTELFRLSVRWQEDAA